MFSCENKIIFSEMYDDYGLSNPAAIFASVH